MHAKNYLKAEGFATIVWITHDRVSYELKKTYFYRHCE